MSKLPTSRVVNVTLTRLDAFPTKRGFGVALLLSNVSVAGKIDATNRTKVYGSLLEVAADHAAGSPVYLAAEDAFSQNPRPLQIKVGYITAANPATLTAATMKTELDAIYDFDPDFYWISTVAALRDIAALDGLIEWTQAKSKFALLDSNDVNTKVAANTTTVAARNKGKFDRTAIFYHEVVAEYPALALAALLGTFNFDEANSAYTAKFKYLAAITPNNLASAAVQAITGFTPALGQATATGHEANTYVDIGGRAFVIEGSTLTPDVFIDTIHATDWIVARTEEETLGVLLNNKRIPFTDVGMETLISGARTVMRQAARAGLIAEDLDASGQYSPAVTFEIPSVFDVPASQRAKRIAPEFRVRFRYAGAVHYTTINYQMTF